MTCPWGSPPGPGAWGHCFPGPPLSWDCCRGLGGGPSRTRVSWAVGRGLDSAQGAPSPGIWPLSPGQRSAPCPPSQLLVYTVLGGGASLGGGACGWQAHCVQLWLRPETSVMLHLQVLNSRRPETTHLLLGVEDDLLPPPHAPRQQAGGLSQEPRLGWGPAPHPRGSQQDWEPSGGGGTAPSGGFCLQPKDGDPSLKQLPLQEQQGWAAGVQRWAQLQPLGSVGSASERPGRPLWG